MANELTYVLVTPYTILKSRAGNIFARLLSETGLELVGARMYAPKEALAKAYASCFPAARAQEKEARYLFRDYILKNFVPCPGQKRHPRFLLFLLRGENAVAKVCQAAGELKPNDLLGDTLRATYGTFVRDPEGHVLFLEPAIMVPENRRQAAQHLKVFAKFADSNGGMCKNLVSHPEGVKVERSLVMLKPENFVRPSRRPGSILDLLARSGLTLIACKVHHMSVAQAEKFYGPNRTILHKVYKRLSARKAQTVLENALGIDVSDEQAQKIGELLGVAAGDGQFINIITFMSGVLPHHLTPAQKNRPGPAKLLLLVYEGANAVEKIRSILGPTDPSKAGYGTIRAEFGHSVMVNAAHASDSVKNAKREMDIVKPGENNIKSIIASYYGKVK